MENAKQSKKGLTEEQKKMRNWWIKTVLLLLLIGLSVAILFKLGDYLNTGDVKQVGFAEMIGGMNVPLFFALLGIILLYIAVESFQYSYLLKIYTGKWRIRTAVKTTFLGKYYDGVTPFSSGGQPFQIYYLFKKHDIPKGAAAAVPLGKMILSLIVWCSFALVLMCFAPAYLADSAHMEISSAICIVAWVSVIFNLSIPVLLAVLSFFPKFVTKLTAILIHLLAKMRIVKRKYAVMKKYVRIVKDYCLAIQTVLKKWKYLLPLLLACFADTAILVAIPVFVVTSVANVPLTGELFVQVMCLQIISQFSAYLIPTPGNMGAAEVTITFVFSTMQATHPAVGGVTGWVILIWRFLTFYIYILSGIGINIFEIARGAYRNRRARKAQL